MSRSNGGGLDENAPQRISVLQQTCVLCRPRRQRNELLGKLQQLTLETGGVQLKGVDIASLLPKELRVQLVKQLHLLRILAVHISVVPPDRRCGSGRGMRVSGIEVVDVVLENPDPLERSRGAGHDHQGSNGGDRPLLGCRSDRKAQGWMRPRTPDRAPRRRSC